LQARLPQACEHNYNHIIPSYKCLPHIVFNHSVGGKSVDSRCFTLVPGSMLTNRGRVRVTDGESASTPLLGIALVVGGHRRGSQLLFSYPKKHEEQQTAKAKSSSRLEEPSAVMNEPHKEAVWGMSEDTFGSLMCPKPALCNRQHHQSLTAPPLHHCTTAPRATAGADIRLLGCVAAGYLICVSALTAFSLILRSLNTMR